MTSRAAIGAQLIDALAKLPDLESHSTKAAAEAEDLNKTLAVFMGWRIQQDEYQGGIDGLIETPRHHWLRPTETGLIYEDDNLPDFLSDMQAALTLLPEKWPRVLYINPGEVNHCHCYAPLGGPWVNISGGSKIVAVAICIAAMRVKLFLEAPVRRKVGR